MCFCAGLQGINPDQPILHNCHHSLRLFYVKTTATQWSLIERFAFILRYIKTTSGFITGVNNCIYGVDIYSILRHFEKK